MNRKSHHKKGRPPPADMSAHGRGDGKTVVKTASHGSEGIKLLGIVERLV